MSIIVKTINEGKRVLNAMDRKEARVLVRTGGYGRGVMRKLIKRHKTVSQPGHPPHAHVPGSGGMKATHFDVTKKAGSVIIGHQKFRRRSRGYTNPKTGEHRLTTSRKPVPQLLNEGGRAKITIARPTRSLQVLNAVFRPRPFRDRAFRPTEKFFKERLRKERL